MITRPFAFTRKGDEGGRWGFHIRRQQKCGIFGPLSILCLQNLYCLSANLGHFLTPPSPFCANVIYGSRGIQNLKSSPDLWLTHHSAPLTRLVVAAYLPIVVVSPVRPRSHRHSSFPGPGPAPCCGRQRPLLMHNTACSPPSSPSE